ncbi:MAG: hypothetical protein KJ044_16740 [Planctomycetes bacterium]|nr:hypothetical protein [Planctomycetota bacterium]
MGTRTSTSWKPGVSGNPGGRPRSVRRVQYSRLRIMDASVSEADWAAIIDKAIEQAREGDATARAWLSKYLLPESPDPFADVTTDGVGQVLTD